MKTLTPGQVVEGHTLIEKIGEGGFGEVWKAEYYGDTVALKIFPRTEGLHHIRSEAVAQYRLGRMNHPDAKYFPRVEHISLDSETPYLRMEYLEGMSLDNYLKENTALTLEQRIALCERILQALSAVHRHNFVHGDLSPGNIIIGPDGAVRLIDVGIGVAFEQEDVRASGGADKPLGVAAPLFASPERFTKAFIECGKQADVYSYGKLVYYLLTGEDPIAIKPLSKRFAELDGSWDEFIYTCLENVPEKRYSDAAAAMEALSRIKDEAPNGFIAKCVSCSTNTLIPESWLGREFTCRACNQKMEVLFLDVDAGEAQVRASETDYFIVSTPAADVETRRAGKGSAAPVRKGDLGERKGAANLESTDYTGKALLCFALFFFFWLPGAIATTVFLVQAKETAKMTGIRPPGIELLEAFMWMFVYIPLGILSFVVLMIATH
jgi:serine/threonine protein kinase